MKFIDYDELQKYLGEVDNWPLDNDGEHINTENMYVKQIVIVTHGDWQEPTTIIVDVEKDEVVSTP